jgi:hypothetical protein
MSFVPPAENVRRSNATDTMVLAPKIYTLRGAFFNKLGYSRKLDFRFTSSGKFTQGVG